MINFKQQELVDKLFQSVKENFPEVELINVIESPEDTNDLWIKITEPEDEDREIELGVGLILRTKQPYLVAVKPHNY